MDCRTTLPGPVSVVTNRTSPLNSAFLSPPIEEMSYPTVSCHATAWEVDTFSTSPGARSLTTKSPHPQMNAIPFPDILWRTNPSPPNIMDPSLFWKASSISTCSSEARNPDFWTSHAPLEASMSMVFPGAAWARPTTPFPADLYWTRNRDAPEMDLFMLAHAPCLAFASRVTLPVMYVMAPATEYRSSSGPISTLSICRLSPVMEHLMRKESR